ncbi:unnamed protein product, partial [Tilletia caries]
MAPSARIRQSPHQSIQARSGSGLQLQLCSLLLSLLATTSSGIHSSPQGSCFLQLSLVSPSRSSASALRRALGLLCGHARPTARSTFSASRLAAQPLRASSPQEAADIRSLDSEQRR